MPISRELALAAACCLTSDADLARRAPSLAAGTFAWDRFERLLAYHGVTGLAGARLRDIAPGLAPADLDRRLLGRLQRDAVLQLAQVVESVRLTARLEAAGVPVLVLKGAALAHMLYAPWPERRHSTDIDLLIDPARLQDADRVLCDAGYQRSWPQTPLPARGQAMLLHLANAFDYRHAETGQLVELHHRMTLNPWCLPAGFGALHGESIMVETAIGPVRGLDGPVFFAYLCWHALGHFDFRLKWIADLARMLDRHGAVSGAGYVAGDSRLAGFSAADMCDTLMTTLTAPQHAGLLSPDDWANDIAWIVAGMDRAEDVPMRRSVARLPGEVRNLRFLRRLAPAGRSRRYELVRALCDPRDAGLLGLGPRFAPLYAVLGPLLAAYRGLERRIAQKPNKT